MKSGEWTVPGDNEIYNNRDRLLGEIHATGKATSDKLDCLKDWFEKHEVKDDERFKTINKNVVWGAVAIFIVAAATGVIPQLTAFALEHFK